MDVLVPARAEIYGDLSFDTAYIRNLLDRMILGKPLTRENMGAFISEVYRTGNYLFVTCRMNTQNNNARFEVHLNPVKQKTARLLIGGSYRGTIANDAISKLNLSTTLQWRGLTGPGSVLSFSATLVNDFAVRFQFMHPLFQKTFVQAGAEFMQDQDFITSGFEGREITGSRVLRAEGGMNVGIKFNREHLFIFGPRLVWMDTSRVESVPEIPAESHDAGTAEPVNFGIPFSLDYTFSTLDFPCLPTRGYFVNVNNQAILTLRGDGDSNLPPVYDVIAVDFTAVVSLNEQVSVAASLFAGSDVTMNLAKVPAQMPVFGFNNFDRMFFPQVAGKQHYGAHKGAAALTLQLHPWKNVTILGGQLFFSVGAGIGQVVPVFTDFSAGKLLWNANLATGFRISDAFGVQLRFGAGAREFTNRVTPFISFDIGSFRL
jgi:NTE family protein